MEPLGILSLDRKKYTQAMAENLPALRARLGLSQTQLADCIGVTRQTISSIENQSRELSWTNFLSLLFLFLQTRRPQSFACDGNLYGRAGAYFFLY